MSNLKRDKSISDMVCSHFISKFIKDEIKLQKFLESFNIDDFTDEVKDSCKNDYVKINKID